MIIVIAKYKEIGRFEKVDERTGQTRVDKSYRVQVAYPDGSVLNETLYFPRDPTGAYREPELIAGEYYAFPVSARPSRDGKKINYTAMIDRLPFAAPKQLVPGAA